MQNNCEFVSTLGTGSTSTCAPSSGLSVSLNSALLAAAFLVGTGGFATPQALNVPAVHSVAKIAHELVQSSLAAQRLMDTQEKLAGIRRYFAVNVTDMAKILRVGRPTVYAWLRDDPTLRANHARRIDEVYGLARKWRSMSNTPIGDFITRSLGSSESLLDLLSAKTLDQSAIETALAQVAETVNTKTRRESIVEIAKGRGFKLAHAQLTENWKSGGEVDV